MKSSDIKLGYTACGYNELRNFLALPFTGVRVKRVIDPFRIATACHRRLTKKTNYMLRNLYWDAGLNRCDINHFFNGISLSSRPWFVTFETALPRLAGPLQDNLARRLAHPSCKRIIAMSQCAYDIQKEHFCEEYSNLSESVIRKMVVLHPAQQVYASTTRCNKPKDTLTFAIVGADFFRKGGGQILKVFDRLIPEYPHLRLNIVSSIQYGDYASRTTRSDYNEAMRIILRHKQQIRHWERLCNDKVIELFRSSDVALLPSWGDTYGYSVLEAQSVGCPVITTNIRALPEINNLSCGWLIDVPRRSSGDGVLDSSADRQHFSSVVEEQLEAHVRGILNQPECIQPKANTALQRIRDEHDPQVNAEKLGYYYRKALM